MPKTRAEITAEIAANFANNTSGAITAALARSTLQDIADAVPNIDGATLYVENYGSDVTGTGTISSPFATPSAAYAAISTAGDASATKPYLIKVGPGVFTGDFAILPFTFVQGYSTANMVVNSSNSNILPGSQTLIDGQITAHASFSTASFPYYGVSDVTLNGQNMRIDLATIGGSSGSVGLFSRVFCPAKWGVSAGDIRFFGRSFLNDIVNFNDCYSQAQGHVVNGTIVITNSVFMSGLSVGISSSNKVDVTLRNNLFRGSLGMQGSPSTQADATFVIAGNCCLTTLSMVGEASLKTDSSSLPIEASVTPSVTPWAITRLNDAFGLAYTPVTPADWAGTPPITIQEALDRLAAASSSPP